MFNKMQMLTLFKLVVVSSILTVGSNSLAQTVIVTDNPAYTTGASSAILDVTTASSNKAILFPVVTSTSNVTGSLVEGLVVYNTTSNSLWYYDGTGWIEMVSSSNYSSLSRYGELYEYNSSVGTTISMALTSNWYGWVSGSSGSISSGITFTDNSTADRLTIGSGSAGKYSLNLAMSFSGSSNASIKAAVYKNGVQQSNLSMTRKLGANGDVGSAVISGIVNMVATDYIDIRFNSDGAGDDIVIQTLNLNIVQIE